VKQPQIYVFSVSRNFHGLHFSNKLNKKIGFDNSKVRCFKCNLYGHFPRECNNTAVQTTQNTLNSNQALTSNTTPPPVNYEKLPNAMTNTLPSDFNSHDYSSKTQSKLTNMSQNGESFDDSDNPKLNKEVYIEKDSEKIKEGHPVKITKYEPKQKQVYLQTKNFKGFVKSESESILISLLKK